MELIAPTHSAAEASQLCEKAGALLGTYAPYSAAKAAVRILMDGCRTESRGSGIRFVSVYPGFVATEKSADDGIPAPFEITENQCARRIVAAMESGRSDAAFPWQTATLTRVLRILPKPLAPRIMLGFVPEGWLDRPGTPSAWGMLGKATVLGWERAFRAQVRCAAGEWRRLFWILCPIRRVSRRLSSAPAMAPISSGARDSVLRPARRASLREICLRSGELTARTRPTGAIAALSRPAQAAR